MPLCGSSVDPHQCGIVRVVGSTLAPPIVVVSACSCESAITCGAPRADCAQQIAPEKTTAPSNEARRAFDLILMSPDEFEFLIRKLSRIARIVNQGVSP